MSGNGEWCIGEGVPGEVIGRLPEPPTLALSGEARPRPKLRQFEFHYGGFFRSGVRLSLWLAAGWRFLVQITVDIIRGRGSQEQRAMRLRHIIQSLGPTFIKLGQQLSARVDLLPYAYTTELEKLLDEVPPLPPGQAIEIIETSLGMRLDQIFRRFDDQPIGSGSIACVYQAVLFNGDHVAVKVRRPRIGQLLASDLRVLGWFCTLGELLFFAPGFTKHFMVDLKTMLFQELDFCREARFSELFRKQIKKAGMRFVTTPKVYPEYTRFNLMVASFVSGYWMTDVLRIVETGDQEQLEKLAQQGIKPKKLASRLLQVSRFGAFEGWMFHADFHPGNILVRPDNKLTLIDFGSCGMATEKERRVWRGWYRAQSENDVSGMVREILGMLDPIPPIDVDTLARELEAAFWDDLCAHKSAHADWWERTTTNLWISFFLLTRKYQIPVNMNILKTIRVSLLTHTLAARLFPGIDHYAEFRRYAKKAGNRARKRVIKRLFSLAEPQVFSQVEQVVETTQAGWQRLQRFLDTLMVNVTKLERTTHFVAGTLLRGVFAGGVVALVLIAGRVLISWLLRENQLAALINQHFFRWEGWHWAVMHPVFLLGFVYWSVLNVRRLLWRLSFRLPLSRL